jgi:hypothetical protein
MVQWSDSQVLPPAIIMIHIKHQKYQCPNYKLLIQSRNFVLLFFLAHPEILNNVHFYMATECSPLLYLEFEISTSNVIWTETW